VANFRSGFYGPVWLYCSSTTGWPKCISATELAGEPRYNLVHKTKHLKLQTELLWKNRPFLLKGARRSGSSAATSKYKHTTGAANTVNLDAVCILVPNFYCRSPATCDFLTACNHGYTMSVFLSM
jgi:hypothetical protein